jgi:hypothetical protein
MTFITILIILLLLFFIFFKSHIKEKFWLGYPQLWMPTRSTRLMSYDLRGDPFGYYIYPPYMSWMMPYRYHLFSPARYDINGRYIVPKGKKIKKVRKIKTDRTPKSA